MTLGLKFLLCLNGNFFNFKKTSNIMDFQLQQMHSCESVGEGVCITKTGTGRNCNTYTIIQC